jgi:4-amino-4-deoxy-L-arabinose transferase-like glycosyltransferase
LNIMTESKFASLAVAMKSPVNLSLLLLTVLVTFGGVMVMEVHGTAVFYAAMARQMVESGDLLAPFRGDTGYLLKPPLAFWWSAANTLVMGYSNLAVTLPSRLGGLGCAVMTALLTWHFHRKPFAVWVAVLLFVMNGIYIQFTTAFRLDSLMTFGALLMLWGYLKLPRAIGAFALNRIFSTLGVPHAQTPFFARQPVIGPEHGCVGPGISHQIHSLDRGGAAGRHARQCLACFCDDSGRGP